MIHHSVSKDRDETMALERILDVLVNRDSRYTSETVQRCGTIGSFTGLVLSHSLSNLSLLHQLERSEFEDWRRALRTRDSNPHYGTSSKAKRMKTPNSRNAKVQTSLGLTHCFLYIQINKLSQEGSPRKLRKVSAKCTSNLDAFFSFFNTHFVLDPNAGVTFCRSFPYANFGITLVCMRAPQMGIRKRLGIIHGLAYLRCIKCSSAFCIDFEIASKQLIYYTFRARIFPARSMELCSFYFTHPRARYPSFVGLRTSDSRFFNFYSYSHRVFARSGEPPVPIEL